MDAFAGYKHAPAFIVLVNFNIFVGDLPEQVFKIFFTARGVYRVCDIGATNGIGAESAFILGCDFNAWVQGYFNVFES